MRGVLQLDFECADVDAESLQADEDISEMVGVNGECHGFQLGRLLLRRGIEANRVEGIEDIAGGVEVSRRATSGTKAAFCQSLCIVSDELGVP